MSIDDDTAFGLVLQKEIALFTESRDGVDVTIGNALYRNRSGLRSVVLEESIFSNFHLPFQSLSFLSLSYSVVLTVEMMTLSLFQSLHRYIIDLLFH